MSNSIMPEADIEDFAPSRRQALAIGAAALLSTGLRPSAAFADSTGTMADAAAQQTKSSGKSHCAQCTQWQATADYIAVSEIIMRERLAREAGNWADEAACFHPDSTVAVSWFEGSGADFVSEAGRNRTTDTVNFDSMSPGSISLTESRAIVDTSCAVHTFSQLEGIEVSTTSYTRLLWRVERLHGRWLIAGLRCIYIRDTLIPRNPNHVPKLDEEKLKTYRPSYRYLSYMLVARGLPAHNDLPGVDRPETVVALRAAERAWLQQG